MPAFQASYRALLANGELARRAETAAERLRSCELCPHQCRVDRRAGELGECRTGDRAAVCSWAPHYGEEPPLVGWNGSGAIFFAWCNLHCRFCQNYELSALGEGRETSAEGLANMMLELQAAGCHNINLVSPSHVVPQFLAALLLAANSGLCVPIVYNTGGYDSVETLRLLDGVVDIYMPDAKYDDAGVAERLSGVCDYPAVNRAAIREMHRQVGDLVTDAEGVALRGLLVRHLVLPEGLAGTPGLAAFLADEISPGTCINVMNQYRPCYEAPAVPPLDRRITPVEYSEAVRAAEKAGLTRVLA